ncbi:hypothetical protein [Paraburkholderia terrae]
MSTQSCTAYRGYDIHVHVTPARAHALGGMCRRYRVSWSVASREKRDREMASFPEQFDFLTEHEAFRYGENRAHTYIDSILSTPSHKRTESERSSMSSTREARP